MKNTDGYIITVTNCQINNGDTDRITEMGKGSLRIKDGRYYIMYKPENVTVMIRIDGDVVNVTRTGEVRSCMEYRLGKTTKFMYNTPYGEMAMEITTKMLAYDIGDCGGEIHLKYDLCGIDNNMEISIRKES